MDSIYGYMDKFDRAYGIIESVTDNKLIKLNYQFDSLMMEHAENLKAIELKVLTESGTDDDLTTLYLAEADEVKEKGKGILAKIIDTIRAFINKIKTTIFGKKPENFPDKVEVDENPDDVVKEGNSLLQSIKNFINGNRKNLKIAGIGAAVAGTIILKGPKIAATYKDLSNFVNNSNTTLEESQKAAENMDATPEEMNLFKTLLNKLKTKVSKASSMAKALRNPEFKQYHWHEKLMRMSKEQKEDWGKFVDAIEHKRVEHVRYVLVQTMLWDPPAYAPTFKIFNKYESYAKKKLPDLYEKHDGEELNLDKAKNNMSWWVSDQMRIAQHNNFSKERIEFLKKLILEDYKIEHSDK